MTSHHVRAGSKSVALILLLAAAAACFLWAGAHGDRGDFAPVYGSIRCVIDHADPYSTGAVSQEIASQRGPVFSAGYWAEHFLLYPPLTYDFLEPLGWLSYPAAGLAWFWICALVMLAGLLSVPLLAPPQTRAVAGIGVAAVLVTSGGLLRLGQLSAVAIGCTAGATMLLMARCSSRSRVVAILIFLIGAAIKPQLVLPMLFVFCLLRPTRNSAAAGMVIFLLASSISGLMLSLQPASAHWIAELRQMVYSATPMGMQARVDTGLIDLKSVTSLAISSHVMLKLVDSAIFAVITGCLWAGYMRAREGEKRVWVLIAGVAFLTMTVTYHRSYDMRLQVLALPALGLMWRARPRIAAWLTLLSGLLLFSTAQPMLRVVQAHWGSAFSHSLPVRLFVERQQAVVVLVAAVSWALVSFFCAWRLPTIRAA